MPKARRGGRTKQAAQPTAQPVPQPSVAPQATSAPTPAARSGPIAYKPLTHQDASALAAMENDPTNYDPSVQAARKMYISNTNFDGKGHSMSQSMNWHLKNGADFHKDTPKSLGVSANDFASMQYTDDYLQRGMHTIGKDTILQRGAHIDDLAPFGITTTRGMSIGQLKKMLVGQHGSSPAYMSTSYDVKSNPFLGSGSGVSGGREVVYEIHAHKDVQCMLGAKKQTELILNKNQGYTIKDVQLTGNTATPRLGSPMPQIKIIIEMD